MFGEGEAPTAALQAAGRMGRTAFHGSRRRAWPARDQTLGRQQPVRLRGGAGGRFLRVQVKSTSCKRNNHYVCAIDGRGKNPYTAADIDFFAIYVIPLDIWYIIPIEASSSASDLSPHNSLSQHAVYREAWHLLRGE